MRTGRRAFLRELGESDIILYPWQLPHASKIAQSLLEHGVAMDQSDPGTGKTACSAWAADHIDFPMVVVVCPRAVIPTWKEWLSKTHYASEGPGPTFRVINYESLKTGNHGLVKRRGKRFRWTVPPGTLVIWDETHFLKGRGSLNSRLLYAAKEKRLPILMAGATPFTTPLELDAMGFALGLHHGYRSFSKWLVDRAGCWQNEFNGWEFSGDPGVLRKLRKFIAGKGSHMLIEEIPDFPESLTMVDKYAIDDAEAVAKKYDEIRGRWIALEKHSEKDAECRLTEILRARQFIELAKVAVFHHLTETELEAGRSVVVFLNFIDSLDALKERLEKDGHEVALVRGGQSNEERQREMDSFQSNRARVILCQIASGGVGISLHDVDGNHPRTSLISPSWTAVDVIQALGRIHRATGKSKAIQRIVLAADTVEEGVAETLRHKLENLDTLRDSDLNPFDDKGLTKNNPATEGKLHDDADSNNGGRDEEECVRHGPV